jgi:hypothetical protein
LTSFEQRNTGSKSRHSALDVHFSGRKDHQNSEMEKNMAVEIDSIIRSIDPAYPSALSFWTTEEARPIAMQQFGKAGEELQQAYMPLLDFILDRADIARQVAAKLGFG